MKESMSMPAVPISSSEDEAVMSRRKFLQAAGATTLAMGAESVVAGQPRRSAESTHKQERSVGNFEMHAEMSGHVQHPDLGKITVEVLIRGKSSRGNDEDAEARVFINGQERKVLYYTKKGDAEGVIFETGQPGYREFVTAGHGERIFQTTDKKGKVINLPIQSK